MRNVARSYAMSPSSCYRYSLDSATKTLGASFEEVYDSTSSEVPQEGNSLGLSLCHTSPAGPRRNADDFTLTIPSIKLP